MEVVRQFIQSACAGDLIDIEDKLKKGVFVDAQDSEGVSALQAAATYGHNDIVEFLLSKFAAVDLPNAYGWTPLMLAARNGRSRTVSTLLKHQAKVNIFNKLGLTPISAAVWSGDVASVKLLLDAGCSIEHVPDGTMGPAECDLVPLMVASFLGNYAIVQMLLMKGTPVNHQSISTGWTPVMLATCSGHKGTIQTLIQWGANINITDVCGRNAIDVAQLRHHYDLKVLLERALSQTAPTKGPQLLLAVRDENVDRVKVILLEEKQTANAIDEQEQVSALMVASMLGNLEIVQLLVSNGAQIDTQSPKDGWNALMYAVFYKHADVVTYLLDNAADIYLCARHRYTIFDLVTCIEGPGKSIIIEALKAKVADTYEQCDPELLRSTAFLSYLPQSRHLSSNDRASTKIRSQPTRLKSWLGNVANRLQAILPRSSSSRHSQSSASASFLDPPNIEINDEVFKSEAAPGNDERPEGSCDVSEREVAPGNAKRPKAMLSFSVLMSPERYLANDLRKHSLSQEAFMVKPKAPAPAIDQLFAELAPIPKSTHVSLRTPNLLRNHTSFSSAPVERSRVFRFNDVTKFTYENLPTMHAGAVHNVPSFEISPATWDLRSPASQTRFGAVCESSQVEVNDSDISSCHMDEELGSLSQVIQNNSLKKHVKKLKDNEVDVDVFKHLTEEDFKEMDINTDASRQKLMDIASKLRVSDSEPKTSSEAVLI